MFSAADFPTNYVVGQDAIQYVIDNVYMFQERYDVVMGYAYLHRTTLRHEDESLFYDIFQCLCEYFDVEEDSESGDAIFDSVEEIFG